MSAGGPILEARNLARQVPSNGHSRTIVDCFSFAFQAGHIYSILGPSGAGKSSLLRLLNRLDEPTSGEVLFDNQDYRSLPPCQLRRQVGYLFQTPFLFPGTVADNLLFAEPELSDDRIDHLLDHASIDPNIKNRPVDNLSLGEKQRVALARLLATEPRVILLDEPTAALDPTYTEKIESSVKQIATDDGLTVIMVSHHPGQARRMGGEGLLIAAGRLVEHGPVEQLVDHPKTEAGRRYRDKELT